MARPGFVPLPGVRLKYRTIDVDDAVWVVAIAWAGDGESDALAPESP